MKKDKINIAVFVSGGGTNLQALIDAEKAGRIKSGTIKLVLSNSRSAYALERAAKAGIESTAVIRKECSSIEEFEDRILHELEARDIDMIILAGFMSILRERFVKKYENRIINIHPSLIPSFCGKGYYGLKVHEAALNYGVKVTGATVHFVNEIPDGGKIIMQKAVDISPDDTPESLQLKVMQQAEWVILPAAAELVAEGLIKKQAEQSAAYIHRGI